MLVPIREYEWDTDFSWMRELTCKNHPDLRWLTKNPYQRNLFFIGDKDDCLVPECDCPFEDLLVIVQEPQGLQEPPAEQEKDEA